ncbi:hypothetical protein [Nocardiopsis sp. B62]|uniref:hypothetical protein n=1 Tax=Nocardiopsis sp. B62 TaxID=2824874 RepID=UPI001B3722AA|nr:hypothetical protein [Nocardiopsis sp. B62]MBQ1083214.1 hypothetical protein [Nocardiopsis sp. B62]
MLINLNERCSALNDKSTLVVLFGLLSASLWTLLMHLIMWIGFVIYRLVGVLVQFPWCQTDSEATIAAR